MEIFTDNLQLIRKKLLLSQNDMAEKMDVSYRAYSSYERGERKPTYDFLQKLVEDFNVNLNFLIAGQGEMFIGQPDKPHQIDEAKIEEIFDNLLKKKGII